MTTHQSDTLCRDWFQWHSNAPFVVVCSSPVLPSAVKGPSRDGTIGEDTIRASLISAVSDKLRWRMKEEMDRAQAELDALKRTEEDLKKGHQKLEEMVSRLDQEVVRGSFCCCAPGILLFSSESRQNRKFRNSNRRCPSWSQNTHTLTPTKAATDGGGFNPDRLRWIAISSC